jgi:hypothetical protein
MNNRLKSYAVAFYVIIAVGFVFILFTNPFLVKLYDPYRYHLTTINEFYKGTIGKDRLGHDMWHFVWANVFKLLGINDIFIWAKIIHVFQFIFAALLIYYFSKTVLTILLKSPYSKLQGIKSSEGFPPSGNDTNDKFALWSIQIKYLSLFSVFLWFIGNGTFSVQYQQAWIMWYSVTYQGLTIPLLWYSIALTFKIFYEELSFKKNLLYIIQIAVASIIIAKFHPMELLYYLISLPIILLMNMKKVFNAKNKIILLITLAIVFFLMFVTVKYFVNREPTLPKLISSNESIGNIIQKINDSGRVIVRSGLNRYPNSFSEVALFSLIVGVLFRAYYFIKKDKNGILNMHLFNCLLILSSIFFLIPKVTFLAGLAGYMTINEQVYRFFFASSWFVFLPFSLYVIVHDNLIANTISKNTFYRIIKEKEVEVSKRKLFIDFIAVSIVLLTLFIVLYKNVFPVRTTILKQFSFKTTILNTKSIINSLDKNKVESAR